MDGGLNKLTVLPGMKLDWEFRWIVTALKASEVRGTDPGFLGVTWPAGIHAMSERLAGLGTRRWEWLCI
jgi:hypothetical protein